jgi:outer membrane lipoprotein SlyB
MMNTSPYRFPFAGRAAACATLAAAALLSGCAAPVTRTVRVVHDPWNAPVASATYVQYGTVSRIEEISTHVGDSGGGSVLGAVIGGVLGNTVGHGMGRAAATGLGIFGGAVVGDTIERNNAQAASSVVYRVFVRFDDGSQRSFDYRGLNGLHSGERVRLDHGLLDRA